MRTQEQSRNNILFLLRREITTRNVSEEFLCKAAIPRFRVGLWSLYDCQSRSFLPERTFAVRRTLSPLWRGLQATSNLSHAPKSRHAAKSCPAGRTYQNPRLHALDPGSSNLTGSAFHDVSTLNDFFHDKQHSGTDRFDCPGRIAWSQRFLVSAFAEANERSSDHA